MANTAIIPLKAIYSGSDVTSLGELSPGDKIASEFLDLSNVGGGNISSNSVDLSAVSQSIIPDANVTYDLGSAEKSWRDLYLSGFSLYVGGSVITVDPDTGGVVLPEGSTVGANTTPVNVAALWGGITGTNTAIRALVGSNLANTNAYIATKADSTTVGSNLANTNAYIASTKSDLWGAITSTNTSIRSAISTEISDLVDSAPATLDTLNELAAALNDDPSFATTIATNLGQKLGATASVTLSGDVTGSASFSANAVTITTDISNSGVSAGSYGSSSAIPVVTVGADGRITSMSTQAVGGVTGITYTAANNTITLSTSDGGNYTATIDQAEWDNYMSVANTTALVSGLQTEDSNLWSAITTTNTAIRTLVDDRMQVANTLALVNDRLQVANAAATYATITTVGSNLANTNAYIATKADSTTVESYLANTNAYIATKADSTTVGGYLANTNAYIATKADSTTVGSNLANTNAYIATKADSTTVESYLANTNSWINSNLANTNAYIASVESSASGDTSDLWSAITTTNTAIRTLVDDRLQVANAAATYATITTVGSNLSNTNAYIASTKSDLWSAITSTNTAIRSYTDTAISNLVDSAPATLDTLNELAAALGDDPSFATTIATNLGQKLGATATVTLTGDVSGTAAFSSNSVTVTTTVADDSHNHVISNVDGLQAELDSKATWTALTGTNTAIRTLVDDRLQVANAAATYATITTVGSNLANTNAYIATKQDTITGAATSVVSSDLTATRVVASNDNGKIIATDITINELTALDNVSSNIQTQLNAKAASTTVEGYLANTNAYIATKADSTTVGSNLANTNAYIATKADITTVEAYLANTNAYIASVENTGSGDSAALWSAITTTNTAIRTLVDDRMQVANVVAYTAKYLEVANSTNFIELTDLSISTQAAEAGGSLSYNNTTGVFNFYPPDLSSYIDLTDLSVSVQAAEGNGSLNYNNSTGVFNFYPPNLSSYATWSALTSTNTAIRTVVGSNLANTNAYIATKQDTITGAASSIVSSNLSATRVVTTDDFGKISDSGITTTELNYLDNVSSNIQTQLNAKAASTTVGSNLANTNAWINSNLANTNAWLANTNAWIESLGSGGGGTDVDAVNDIVDSKIQVLNIQNIIGDPGNPGDVLISNGDGTGYWSNGMREFLFFAANNQTEFYGEDNFGSTLSYKADKINVFLNGVKLIRTDYQANNGVLLVLNEGSAANDIVEIVSYPG